MDFDPLPTSTRRSDRCDDLALQADQELLGCYCLWINFNSNAHKLALMSFVNINLVVFSISFKKCLRLKTLLRVGRAFGHFPQAIKAGTGTGAQASTSFANMQSRRQAQQEWPAEFKKKLKNMA
ncbi:MAG: hypothetical protein ACR2Q4_18365 [Geminicoccaceae bacterium]